MFFQKTYEPSSRKRKRRRRDFCTVYEFDDRSSQWNSQVPLQNTEPHIPKTTVYYPAQQAQVHLLPTISPNSNSNYPISPNSNSNCPTLAPVKFPPSPTNPYVTTYFGDEHTNNTVGGQGLNAPLYTYDTIIDGDVCLPSPPLEHDSDYFENFMNSISIVRKVSRKYMCK